MDYSEHHKELGIKLIFDFIIRNKENEKTISDFLDSLIIHEQSTKCLVAIAIGLSKNYNENNLTRINFCKRALNHLINIGITNPKILSIFEIGQ